MAMSDWDKLAFDEEGKSFVGVFSNKEGNSVEIYKNWLYVQAPKMWTPGDSSFAEPTIAQITNGYINLAGFEIYSHRGLEQNSVFCLVLSYKPGDKFERKIEGGIGCYGYENEAKVVLTQLNRLNDYQDGKWSCGWSSEEGNFITNLDTNETIYHNYESNYIGVSSESLAEFKTWVASLELGSEVSNWLSKVNQNRPLRHNQFDGVHSVSEVGQDPQAPLINKLISGTKDKK